MSGAAKRSANLRPDGHLAEGAGETVPLGENGNFEGRPHLEPHGFVYFVSDGEAVKIGFSEKPARRLAGIQSHHPKPLTLLGTVSASVFDEQDLHQKFSDIRIRGEWFRATPELLAFIVDACAQPNPASAPARPESPADQIRRHLVALAQSEWPPLVSCYFQSVDWALNRAEKNPDDAEPRQSLAHYIDGLENNVQFWRKNGTPTPGYLSRLPMSPQLKAYAKSMT